MFLPRVISHTAFDIGKSNVSVCPNEWTAPEAYDALVGPAWEDLVKASRVWDGTYYRVLNADALRDGIGPVALRLGTIRYRYVATYPMLHQHHALDQLEPLYHLSTIALIRTRDGYYLFGKRSRNGEIDLIGGGVQSDELVITSGADLERNLLKEIREEVGIAGKQMERLTGIGILLSSTSNVLIVGHADATLTREEAIATFALRTEEEMAEPVFVPEDELCRALRSMRDYRRLIPELMQPSGGSGLQ